MSFAGFLVLIAVVALAPSQQAVAQQLITEYAWPVHHPGPFGNVPRLSLPSALGPLLQYQTEWWYLVGPVWAEGGERFTVQVQILRASQCSPLLQTGVTVAGIGRESTQEYVWEQSYGFGLSQGRQPSPLACITAPPPTDNDFQLHFRPNLYGNGTMSFWYDKAASNQSATGEQGAVYHVETNGTEVSLQVKLLDVRGMVLEGVNGIIAPPGSVLSVGSYEWANPVQRVLEGTLTFKGRKYKLMGGNLWHDRQFTTNPPSPKDSMCPKLEEGVAAAIKASNASLADLDKLIKAALTLAGEHKGRFGEAGSSVQGGGIAAGRRLTSQQRQRVARRLAQHQSATTTTTPTFTTSTTTTTTTTTTTPTTATKQLYVGTWVGLVLNNNVSLALACFWNHLGGGQQWISGSKVGRPPIYNFGTLYHSYSDASVVMDSQSGLTPLGPKDFDINILHWANPEKSPHYTSKKSNQTYSTAWELTINRRKLNLTPSGQQLPAKMYMFSLVDKAECLLPDVNNAFGEGAAAVYADKKKQKLIGWAFVEQMGYTN